MLGQVQGPLRTQVSRVFVGYYFESRIKVVRELLIWLYDLKWDELHVISTNRFRKGVASALKSYVKVHHHGEDQIAR